MTQKPNHQRPALRVIAEAPSAQLEELAAPDDQGLSLEELGQAYAALLGKGADPYAGRGDGEQRAGDEDQGTDDRVGALGRGSGVGRDEELPAVIRGADDAAGEISPKSILEAMLFVGHPTGEPLTSERIAALMRGVRPAEIDELVEELNAEYVAEAAPYAIISVNTGYQLTLRPEFGPLRDHFHGRVREARLSQAAVDVLAIVAYHPGIASEEIDRLRGKPSGAILSQMVRRDLLRIERAAEKRSKPAYHTTSRFLDLFGLEDLGELPRSQEIEREL